MVWTCPLSMGQRDLRPGSSRPDSEQFRSAPRIGVGRVEMRQTACVRRSHAGVMIEAGEALGGMPCPAWRGGDTAGGRDAPSAMPISRTSLSGSRLMSLSRRAPQWWRLSGPRPLFRLSSRQQTNRLAAALLRVWRDLEAMLPGCQCSRPILPENALDFCARSSQVCAVWGA
jgi:hypothetical protein